MPPTRARLVTNMYFCRAMPRIFAINPTWSPLPLPAMHTRAARRYPCLAQLGNTALAKSKTPAIGMASAFLGITSMLHVPSMELQSMACGSQKRSTSSAPSLRSCCVQGKRQAVPPEPEKLPYYLLGVLVQTHPDLTGRHTEALGPTTAKARVACDPFASCGH